MAFFFTFLCGFTGVLFYAVEQSSSRQSDTLAGVPCFYGVWRFDTLAGVSRFYGVWHGFLLHAIGVDGVLHSRFIKGKSIGVLHLFWL